MPNLSFRFHRNYNSRNQSCKFQTSRPREPKSFNKSNKCKRFLSTHFRIKLCHFNNLHFHSILTLIFKIQILVNFTFKQFSCLGFRISKLKRAQRVSTAVDVIASFERKTLEENDRLVLEQISCSVCKENFEKNDKTIKVSCNHIFHVDCITPWFEISNKCPSCRAVFKIN